MRSLIASLLRYRPLMVVALVAWIAGGHLYVPSRLDIEAYPDPSPPLVEVITQNPSWSAEEMERQVTVPIETVLFGIPRLEYVRSTTIFGLSDVKLYFGYDSDYFWDRQEVLNRLQLVSLPSNLEPAAFARIAHRGNLPLPAVRAGLQPERTEGDAGLVRYARDQAGFRDHRRGGIRRQHARSTWRKSMRESCCSTK